MKREVEAMRSRSYTVFSAMSLVTISRQSGCWLFPTGSSQWVFVSSFFLGGGGGGAELLQ